MADTTSSENDEEEDFDSSSDEQEYATEKYGYGDAAPDTEYTSNHLLTKAKQLLPRENSFHRRNSSTICHQTSLSVSEHHYGSYVEYENFSLDPHRVPRRSSIEGQYPHQRTPHTAHRRRASIAGCTTTSSTTTVPGGRRTSLKRRSSIKSLASVTMLALAVTLPSQGATATP